MHSDLSEILLDSGGYHRFIRWRDVVRHAFGLLGDEASFADVVETIERIVPASWLHRHWTVRLHRLIQTDPLLEKAGRDRWRLRSRRARSRS
jgi:hypothetical protein